MLRIRLRRVGRKKQPSYRVVVAESTSPRDGRFVEVVGFYNPRTEPETVRFKEDRALYWLSVGAQPSEAVMRMLKNTGTLERLARLRAGEPMELLVAEAKAAAAESKISPKTEPVTQQASVEDAEAAEAAEVAEDAEAAEDSGFAEAAEAAEVVEATEVATPTAE